MNHLHPVFHGHAYQLGSRVDIERILPADLADEDCDFLSDDYSEPPRFIERISPVSVQIGDETVRGRNWTELMIKAIRVLSRIFTNITLNVHQTVQVKFGQKGMVPFMSMDFDADAMHRVIEMDNETNDNTYGRLVELFTKGVLAPAVTVPFHIVLPTMKNDFNLRMLVRVALDFYWPIVKKYHQFMAKVHNEKQFVLIFWLPEGGFSHRVREAISEEFMKKARQERVANPHLVLLLDNDQCTCGETDVLMKSWNIMNSDAKPGQISIIFRDRNFSDWVTHSKPSVKKLIDRTIAKVDAELNEEAVDYSWAHYEDIHALCHSQKAAKNFEQKIIKLTELGYMSIAPDVFVRRKLLKRFGRAKFEPHKVELKDNMAWNDWHSGNINFGRWTGLLDSNADTPIVDEDRPFFRQTEKGEVKDESPQCWKIALNLTVGYLADKVIGDTRKMNSGLLSVLMKLTGVQKKKASMENVSNFLMEYNRILWREHYIYHGDTEADLHLRVLCEETLCRGSKKEPSDEEVIIAGTAAQAYYFALHSYKSFGFAFENFDQRSVYQNVMMLALSLCNMCYVYHWTNRKKEADELVADYLEYLVNFEHAFERFGLADYGVQKSEWQKSIESALPETSMNLVERATRRIGARHLRPLGYRKEFSKEDENLTTNVGHIWSSEVSQTNFKWDNPIFCGVVEE